LTERRPRFGSFGNDLTTARLRGQFFERRHILFRNFGTVSDHELIGSDGVCVVSVTRGQKKKLKKKQTTNKKMDLQ